jgi:hypothetical protein
VHLAYPAFRLRGILWPLRGAHDVEIGPGARQVLDVERGARSAALHENQLGSTRTGARRATVAGGAVVLVVADEVLAQTPRRWGWGVAMPGHTKPMARPPQAGRATY